MPLARVQNPQWHQRPPSARCGDNAPFATRFPFALRGEGAGRSGERVRLPYSLGVCWCCRVGAAKAPVATLLSLHPDRDIIASRVSAALLRAHTAAAAAQRQRACSSTHPSTKSGIRTNSRVITSDAHLEIKALFLLFSSPPPAPASGPFPPHRH